MGRYTDLLSSASQEALWTFSPENIKPLVAQVDGDVFVTAVRILKADGAVFAESGNPVGCTIVSKPVTRGKETIGSVELCYSTEWAESNLRNRFVEKSERAIFFLLINALVAFFFLRLVLQRKVHVLVEEIRAIERGSADLQPFEIKDELDEFRKAYRISAEKSTRLMYKLMEQNQDQEKVIQDRSTQIVQSAKLVSLGRMAGGVAHEINNPLAIILGRTALIKDQVAAGELSREKLMRFFEQLENSSRRIEKVTKGLLAFSRVDTDAVTEVQLAALVDQMLALCRQSITARGIQLQCEVPQDIKITCNASDISKVLMNLVQNSMDAVGEKENSWIRISAHREGEDAVIEVIDSGTGIDAEVRRHLFDPFVSSKDPGKGMGLGLSSSLGIVRAHGGFIQYDGLAKNTRFVVRLPLSPANEKTA